MIRLTDIICEINPELIDEAGRYKYVVRNRKKVKKLVHRPGYKIVNGKYVRMKSSEKIKRKIAARKASKKRKAKKSQIKRKRSLSMKKRKSYGLGR